MAAYIAALKELSEFCEYGESLPDMLRDRLVVGINDEHIQHRLLAEPKLTFAKAEKIALTIELATQDT